MRKRLSGEEDRLSLRRSSLGSEPEKEPVKSTTASATPYLAKSPSLAESEFGHYGAGLPGPKVTTGPKKFARDDVVLELSQSAPSSRSKNKGMILKGDLELSLKNHFSQHSFFFLMSVVGVVLELIYFYNMTFNFTPN